MSTDTDLLLALQLENRQLKTRLDDLEAAISRSPGRRVAVVDPARRRRIRRAWTKHLKLRFAICACGHVDQYPAGHGKRGSPGYKPRLRDQRCTGCKELLGYGAGKRWLDLTQTERVDRKVARQTRALEVAFGRPRAAASPETPVLTSAGGRGGSRRQPAAIERRHG